MVTKIKLIIAKYFALKKYAQKQDSELNFNSFFSDSKSVLIVFPSSISKLSLEIIELVRFIAIHKKKLFFIHKSIVQKYLPNDFEYAALVVGESDKTRIGLPTTDLVNRIKKYEFDLVIDLNDEEDIFSSAIANIPKADFRIGFIKENSDKFYNYQICSEINSEKSLRNLLNSLRMF